MHIADHLSRSYLDDKVEDDPEMTEVVHTVSLSEYLSLSDKQLEQIKIETKKDHILSQVLNYVDTYWKKFKLKTQINNNDFEQLKCYYKLRDQLINNDGVLFLKEKIIIPSSLRKNILKVAHGKAHLGIVKCKLRLRKMYYWPMINNDIEKFVKMCKSCEKYQRSSIKEPLISHDIPEYPLKMLI